MRRLSVARCARLFSTCWRVPIAEVLRFEGLRKQRCIDYVALQRRTTSKRCESIERRIAINTFFTTRPPTPRSSYPSVVLLPISILAHQPPYPRSIRLLRRQTRRSTLTLALGARLSFSSACFWHLFSAFVDLPLLFPFSTIRNCSLSIYSISRLTGWWKPPRKQYRWG